MRYDSNAPGYISCLVYSQYEKYSLHSADAQSHSVVNECIKAFLYSAESRGQVVLVGTHV